MKFIKHLQQMEVIVMSRKRIDIVKVQLVKESSLLYESGTGKRQVNSPTEVVSTVSDFIGNSDRECFVVLCLNTKNEPTNLSVVAIGALNKAIIHPREVFKTAILSNAASIICAHNHPSGDSTPSQADIDLTHRLYEAGELIGIKILDHLVIGDGEFTSLKEKGYL